MYDYDVNEMNENTEVVENKQNGSKPPKRDKRKIIIPIIIVVIAILVAVAFVMYKRIQSNNNVEEPVEEVEETPLYPDSSIDFTVYLDLWYERYNINSDYVGDIVFESGLINLPVVQYIDEDNLSQGYYEYLRTDWETMEADEEGSIFIDPYTYLDSSMNVVIYGHFVYASLDPTRTHMFTPLEQLLDEENYEENSIFYLVLENEIRAYQIAHVYLAQLYSSNGTDYDMLADGMLYMKADWTEAEFTYYIQQVNLIEQYDTGIEIEYGERFLTLQTCVENRDDLREIVIAKEIGVYSYRESSSE